MVTGANVLTSASNHMTQSASMVSQACMTANTLLEKRTASHLKLLASKFNPVSFICIPLAQGTLRNLFLNLTKSGDDECRSRI